MSNYSEFNGHYNVKEHGASGGGEQYDTTAVQKAIDLCHKNGGGTVLFPGGGTYLIGTISLLSNVTLHIAGNARILGSDQLADYADDTGISPYYPEPLDRCLIYACEEHNIRLTGEGIIDGNFRGKAPVSPKEADGRGKQRPMLIRFEKCDEVHISGLRLENAFSWCTHLKYCSYVHLYNVTIRNKKQDGFNIESCAFTTISDCHLECGDDGIALTTSSADKPLTNLSVVNCHISSKWAAVRLGPLSKGNFENITVSNCVFQNCGGGGVKMGMFEGAEIKNCIFSNIVMDRVTAPVSMFLGNWTDIGSMDNQPPLMPLGKIKNVYFNNLRATAVDGPVSPWRDRDAFSARQIADMRLRPDQNSVMIFHGHPESVIESVFLSNIHITFPGGGTADEAERRDVIDINDIAYHSEDWRWTEDKNVWGVMPAYGVYARHIENLNLNNTTFECSSPEKRPAIFCQQSSSITLSHLSAEADNYSPLIITKDCGEPELHGCKTNDNRTANIWQREG